MVSDAQDIQQSLRLVLATAPGERAMRETFGCDLQQALFEDLDPGLIGSLKRWIEEAVLQDEPRVVVEGLEAELDDDEVGRLSLHLSYRIVGTNSRFNLVFPFYLHEANVPVA